ncbi:MAG: EamA family transporter [Thermoflexales bacterium]|nr:EamA family transporter [Thermoflexales bacterium]
MNRLIGALLIIVSAASFGTLAIFGRYAYADGLDTFTILALRFTLGAVLMAGLLAVRRERWPRGSTLVRLIGMGALGYVGQSFCYLTATQFASPGLVALLLYLYPVFVAILSAIFLKEKFTPIKIAALALATFGAALTANPQGGQWTGILLAVTAAAIYSVYIIVGTGVMRKVSAFQSSTVIFASAGAVYATLALIRGPQLPQSGAGWAAVIAIVLIATVIPVVTFLAGLRRIGPTNASMLSTVEPIVTVLLAALLFGDVLTPEALIGGALILIAVVMLTRGELRQSDRASAAIKTRQPDQSR